MAMSASIVQPLPAVMGQPTTFVVTVSNSGASQVSVYSIQPIAQTPSGVAMAAANIGPIFVTPQLGAAQVGSYQLNVPIAGGASQAFTFQVSFFGPFNSFGGNSTTPNMAYQVVCNILTSDNAVFTTPPLNVPLNTPTLGVVGSSLQSSVVPTTGSLQFFGNLNSNLAL